MALPIKKWTLSGDVLLVGDTPARIKLGAFYTHCHDFYYASQKKRACSPATLVSNAAEISAPDGRFTLEIDVSSLSPTTGDYIYLILWADANDNDAYDPQEDWRYVIPLYDDCIFNAATDCVFYYDERESEERGTASGWNHSIGLGRFAPLAAARMDGARLSNETAWETTSARSPV